MERFIHITVYGETFRLGQNIQLDGHVYEVIGEEIRGSGRRITLEQKFTVSR